MVQVEEGKIVEAFQISLSNSNDAAIINMGEIIVPIEEINSRMHKRFHLTTIREILEKLPFAPKEITGTIITGYFVRFITQHRNIHRCHTTLVKRPF